MATRPTPVQPKGETWDTGSGTAQRAEWLAQAMLAHLPPGRVAEIGAGTGLLGAHLLANGRPTIAIEPAADLVRLARRRQLRAIVASPTALPLRDQVLDGVVAASLARVPMGVAELSEVARVLRPRGRAVLVISDPHPPTRDPIRDILEPMRRSLGAQHLEPAALIEAGERAELRGYVVRLPNVPYRRSPEEEASDLQRRASSVVWGADDAAWRGIVQPTIELLRSLPDPDVPLLRVAYHLAVVFDMRGQIRRVLPDYDGGPRAESEVRPVNRGRGAALQGGRNGR